MRLALTLILAVSCRCQDASTQVVEEGLPGAPLHDAALAARLDAAIAAKGLGYKPNTRHLRDGKPLYTNRLALEASPYLILHAHNPVDWYPWGDEAFAKAERENKPILLSIGYSTCHWCHVMAEESFEDVEIARVLNRDYVPIKVDREERPDLDAVYLDAVQRMTGDGGWPLTVWLLPDRRPFFGGTYFPPKDGERGARVGFATLLGELHRAFVEHRDELMTRAGAVVAELERSATAAAPAGMPNATTIRAAVAQYAVGFDPTWGGFGGAPKFPRPAVLDLLLRYARRTGDASAQEMVTRTLEKMAAGGVYDQIGGGFHRYSTDAKWRVPHFEKMLYDNAQLAAVYLDAYRATGRSDFADVARETLTYLSRDMRSPDGGFYSASDADSEGGEGAYFTWTAAEIDRIVGEDSGRIVREYFDVTAGGNFARGTSILWRPRSRDEVAERLQIPPDRVLTAVLLAGPELWSARTRRSPPAIDRKILVGWNGLAIAAFARAALAFDDARLRDIARTAAALVLERGRTGGRLQHAVGVPGPAFLDDHAFLIAGLLDLFAADPDPRWLREAIALAGELDRRFADPAGGDFFTASDHETLLVRDKTDSDEALPSGNSVAALALYELAELTGDDRYRTRADGILRAFAGKLARTPTALPTLLAALERSLDRTKQIVLAGPPATLLAPIRTAYLPNRIVVVVDATPPPEVAALVDGKTMQGGKPTAYVCIGTRCERPTTDPAELARQLAKIEPL